MYLENVTTIDPTELAFLLGLLLAFAWVIWRAGHVSRAERCQRIAADRAYSERGGLVRALMAR